MASNKFRHFRTRKRTKREAIHDIIFEHDTFEGKAFDIVLLLMILLSITIVMLDSVSSYHEAYGDFFYQVEWALTILFTIEYVLRLYSVDNWKKYAISFFGIVDLIAIIPTYMSFFLVGVQSLIVLRGLRLLRIFRIFKLTGFMFEMTFLKEALKNSLKKVSIFILVVIFLVVIMGSVMYLVEKSENGFVSIPHSIYWAIVTITTVGYGDIAPVTPLGKFIASFIMLLGYGIIAVPTGIVTTEMAMYASKHQVNRRVECASCHKIGHDDDAVFCKSCGGQLVEIIDITI